MKTQLFRSKNSSSAHKSEIFTEFRCVARSCEHEKPLLHNLRCGRAPQCKKIQ